MITAVQKWGNSLGVRIPKSVAQDAGLKEGVKVDVRSRNNRLIMRPFRQKKYALDELVKKINKTNRHKEIAMNPPLGKEVW